MAAVALVTIRCNSLTGGRLAASRSIAPDGANVRAGGRLGDRREMGRILHSSKGDSTIMLATLAATLLLPLEVAVLAGISFPAVNGSAS